MNQQIKELVEQADAYANEQNELYGVDFKTAYNEKFAELIVLECIEQASISNGHGNNQWDKALTFAADNIKKHFGVEQ